MFTALRCSSEHNALVCYWITERVNCESCIIGKPWCGWKLLKWKIYHKNVRVNAQPDDSWGSDNLWTAFSDSVANWKKKLSNGKIKAKLSVKDSSLGRMIVRSLSEAKTQRRGANVFIGSKSRCLKLESHDIYHKSSQYFATKLELRTAHKYFLVNDEVRKIWEIVGDLFCDD